MGADEVVHGVEVLREGAWAAVRTGADVAGLRDLETVRWATRGPSLPPIVLDRPLHLTGALPRYLPRGSIYTRSDHIPASRYSVDWYPR